LKEEAGDKDEGGESFLFEATSIPLDVCAIASVEYTCLEEYKTETTTTILAVFVGASERVHSATRPPLSNVQGFALERCRFGPSESSPTHKQSSA
jgi:hypothetical protein